MSTRERKVTYKIEVEAGKGGTAVLDDVQRKATEAKNSVLALAKSLNEAAKAQVAVSTAAARSSVAGTGASRAGGGGGRAEINRELDGILRERAAYAERERKLATKTAEQERKLMSERIKANVEASRAAREAAKETTGDHYRGRAAEKALRDEQRARDERMKGFADESAARRKAAVETNEMARNTMKLVDSYKHLAHGGMLAARSFVMLTAANESTLEAGLRKIEEYQGYVDAASSLKELGVGVGGAVAGAGSALGYKGLTAAKVGQAALQFGMRVAPPAALAGISAYSLWGFSKMFEESGYDTGRRRREVPVLTEAQNRELAFSHHESTMAGVSERLAELDKMKALNEIRQSALDRIGLGTGIDADIAANARKIRRLEAEYSRGQRLQMFDVAGMLGKVSDTPRGRAMVATAYHEGQVEGSEVSRRSAFELVDAERERLQLVERRGQVELQTAQRSVELARQTLQTEQERLAMITKANMDRRELYGMATQGERQQIDRALANVKAEQEARTARAAAIGGAGAVGAVGRSKVTREDFKALGDFQLGELARPFVLEQAQASPGYAAFNAALEKLAGSQQRTVDELARKLEEAAKKANEQPARTTGLLDAIFRVIDARGKQAEEANIRAAEAKAREEEARVQLKNAADVF